MICWTKWKRYLSVGLACLFGAILFGICAERQNIMREETIPASAMTEETDRTDDYIELRIARDKNRSEARDLLVRAAEAEADSKRRQEKQDALWQADKNRQAEAELETVIKARGFDDAVVFCQDDSATVLVRTSALTHDETAELASLVTQISGVKQERILIRAKQ